MIIGMLLLGFLAVVLVVMAVHSYEEEARRRRTRERVRDEVARALDLVIEETDRGSTLHGGGGGRRLAVHERDGEWEIELQLRRAVLPPAVRVVELGRTLTPDVHLFPLTGAPAFDALYVVERGAEGEVAPGVRAALIAHWQPGLTVDDCVHLVLASDRAATICARVPMALAIAEALEAGL